jgi:hypothetical protein
MGAPDRRRPTIATEAEVLALATSTGAVLLRAFAAAAARCAATGCTICARADDLYTRALAVRAGTAARRCRSRTGTRRCNVCPGRPPADPMSLQVAEATIAEVAAAWVRHIYQGFASSGQ